MNWKPISDAPMDDSHILIWTGDEETPYRLWKTDAMGIVMPSGQMFMRIEPPRTNVSRRHELNVPWEAPIVP